MHATIDHPSLTQPWSGTVPVSDYTVLSAAARGYGQAKVHIPNDHPLITDTSITAIRGLQITIHQGLLGSQRYVQVGKAARTERGYDLTCFEIAYLLKLIKVPVQATAFTNLPAGAIVKLALVAGLAMTQIPIVPGAFAEAGPLVERYEFTGQSVDQVVQDMMTQTGQEWEIDSLNRFNWIGRQGTYYETALTSGYDFCALRYFEVEDDPVGRVIVTDQRGYVAIKTAQEHAADLTARTVSQRADTPSSGATDQLAQSILNDGRVVRAVGQIGLYPHGGSIEISLPGIGGGGGSGFALMGGGFVLMGGGFPLMGGGGASSGTVTYPTFDAPNWAIRPGDVVRIIAPNAGIRGANAGLYRVRGYTFGDAHLYPVLDLVQEPYWTAETIPVGKRGMPNLGASPPMTLERLLLLPFQRQGTPVDAARIASQLAPQQVPALSSINGSATADQIPNLEDQNGAVTAAQLTPVAAFADIGAAPTQTDFNDLLQRLRDFGALSP